MEQTASVCLLREACLQRLDALNGSRRAQLTGGSRKFHGGTDRSRLPPPSSGLGEAHPTWACQPLG